MTPIVFIPGLICTAEIFAPQLAALWPHGPVTVASTMTGDTIAEMADAILADAPPTFALVGFSMGGYISLEIMRRAPERVVKLALIDTSARPYAADQIATRRALMERASNGDYDGVLKDMIPLLFHPEHRHDPTLLEIGHRMGLAVGAEAFVRQQEAIIGRPDSRPHLKTIKAPTLVVVGDRDGLTPPERSIEMSRAIPRAQLNVVPGCGHATTIEKPDLVNRALLEWIART